eukprot:1657356-Pleurochrysis_carterae.AAC.1
MAVPLRCGRAADGILGMGNKGGRTRWPARRRRRRALHARAPRGWRSARGGAARGRPAGWLGATRREGAEETAAMTRGVRVDLREAGRWQRGRHGAARREGAGATVAEAREATVAETRGERVGLREAGRR